MTGPLPRANNACRGTGNRWLARIAGAAGASGRMGNVTVLMYHAVTQGGLVAEGHDPRYAVSRDAFRRQLALFRCLGYRPTSVAAMRADGAGSARTVGMTFDDGWETDAGCAVPELLAAGGAGDFFVNTSTVGSRGYVSATELRDMHAAGMSIQSHGHTHRYLDDLSTADIRAELEGSKKRLEDMLGAEVTLFAPAGGRMPGRAQRIARAVGYAAVCGSRPGVLRDPAAQMVPRLAVLASTSDEVLRDWVLQRAAAIRALEASYVLRAAARKVAGNGGYEVERRLALNVLARATGKRRS
jgi:peptidoglycan/xylan/chitin deacetylase (PgdA/CDA1 family)